MEEILKTLEEVSEKIEKAKKNKASLEGRQMELLKQLKERCKARSIEEAEILLKEYRKKSKELEIDITKRFSQVKRIMGAAEDKQ